MTKTLKHTKPIKNTLQGHHLNSKHWQNHKSTLPSLSQPLFDTAVGMILGDATMYHVSREAVIKFEQGYKQKEFVFHLFDLFSPYCFMQKAAPRYAKNGDLKSYWFKTFSFPCFTQLYHFFYDKKGTKNHKRVKKGVIANYLTPRGLAYWIMCDGSLQKDYKSLILHTQSFTFGENVMLSLELNEKFHLHSRVIPHKVECFAIEIPKGDSQRINQLISPFMIPSMMYKVPKFQKIV